MSKEKKLIEKILQGRNISYEEAEKILLRLNFEVDIKGSHHTSERMVSQEYFSKKAFSAITLSN